MKALILLGAALAYSVVSSARGVRPRSNNPFEGMNQFANPEYADRVSISAEIFRNEGESELARKAIQIQNHNPTWTWIDNGYKVPKITEYLQLIVDSTKTNVIGTFVIFNLPDRECGTTRHGELLIADDGARRYKAFIDDIRAAVSKFSGTPPVAFIIEPAAITNMISFGADTDCIFGRPVHRELITYAVTQLALPNVALYLDGGDGWMLGLGWPVSEAGRILADIYKKAGNPPNLRGVAINVGAYSPWIDEFCANNTLGNDNCDDKRYTHSLAQWLVKEGWEDPHFIIDQSRSGVPSRKSSRFNYCNIAGTGFGFPPGARTNDTLVDSFVWAKPGGISDGTDDKSSPNFDINCESKDALKPAPEYGTWFLAYFRQLIINANPPIVPT